MDKPAPTLNQFLNRFLKPMTPKEHKIAKELEKEYWRHQRKIAALGKKLDNAEFFNPQ